VLASISFVTGPWSISFLLLVFPATLVIGLHLGHTDRSNPLRIVGAGLERLFGCWSSARCASTWRRRANK
jgi:hypothetical protein